MLAAAAPNRDRVLENLVMFLVLKASDDRIPDVLGKRFFATLAKSSEILNDPSKISPQTTSESVSLATRMMLDEELKKLLSEANRTCSISKEEARTALNRLEGSYADRRESPGSGEAVFAIM